MSKNLEIRLALEKDAQSIYEVHTQAIRDLCSSHYSPEEIKQWAGRQRIDKYQSLIKEGAISVGVLNGEVVGFGNIDRYTEDTGEICGLYVSPQHARMGVGRTLFRHLEDRARATGYMGMRVRSTLNAEPFYQAMGYRTVSEDRHVMGGLSLRCVLMCKTL